MAHLIFALFILTLLTATAQAASANRIPGLTIVYIPNTLYDPPFNPDSPVTILPAGPVNPLAEREGRSLLQQEEADSPPTTPNFATGPGSFGPRHRQRDATLSAPRRPAKFLPTSKLLLATATTASPSLIPQPAGTSSASLVLPQKAGQLTVAQYTLTFLLTGVLPITLSRQPSLLLI